MNMESILLSASHPSPLFLSLHHQSRLLSSSSSSSASPAFCLPPQPPSFSSLLFLPLSSDDDDDSGDDDDHDSHPLSPPLSSSHLASPQLCSSPDAADDPAHSISAYSSDTQELEFASNGTETHLDAIAGPSLPSGHQDAEAEFAGPMLDWVSVVVADQERGNGSIQRSNSCLYGGAGDLEKRQKELRRRRSSVCDGDFSELKGCIDLGFRFDERSAPRLCHILPALEVYCAVAHSFHELPFPTTPWRITNPGDSQEDVKERLKHWAQAVACDLRLHR